MKKKILAITPYFSRSGSEIALFNLLDYVKIKYNISIFTNNSDFELKNELSSDIELIVPEIINRRRIVSRKKLNKVRLMFNLKPRMEGLEKLLIENQYDFIILNTLLSLSFYKKVKEKSGVVVVYVHETEQGLVKLNKEKLNFLIDKVDLILCSSNYVKNYMISLGRKGNIEVLYPSLNFEKFSLDKNQEDIRKSLGFNKGDFIWAMSGDLTINKNPAMFLKIAHEIIKTRNNVSFLWIGISGENVYESYLQKKLKELRIINNVKFIRKQDTNYYKFINEVDGLVLTSFSESYSLVSKEFACFNKPVVSFPCGGVIEAVPKENLLVAKEFSIEEIVKLMKFRMNHKLRNIETKDLDFLFSNEKGIVGDRFIELLNL